MPQAFELGWVLTKIPDQAKERHQAEVQKLLDKAKKAIAIKITAEKCVSQAQNSYKSAHSYSDEPSAKVRKRSTKSCPDRPKRANLILERLSSKSMDVSRWDIE
ncbi:cystatin/monellin superfamily protein [Striga asiatica]|uniref:Cystatin/monellin superfamily protein n=1 Tax=Striga asiatica TaxID=4170 RepID=A0A5A7PMD9_STRAF|nr:cystatin/monellin superfamily protein [Striga asiatica]